MPTLKRKLRLGDKGTDVRMIQRALNKAPSHVVISVDGELGQSTYHRLMAYAVAHGVPFNGSVDQNLLNSLWPYFDAYGKSRYKAFRPPPIITPEEKMFDKLLSAMKALDANSQGYLLGANHGVALDEADTDDYYDCSSSCSKALRMAGMWPWPEAKVSGSFWQWGEPGQGKFFTVYYNGEHVWIRLPQNKWKCRWWRFDTSPHVDGRPSENPRRGPRLRFFPRFTSSFHSRHWPGL